MLIYINFEERYMYVYNFSSYKKYCGQGTYRNQPMSS